MRLNETRVVNLGIHSWVCRRRVAWQQLFDLYREGGGDCRNLDNMLIDYNFLCKQQRFPIVFIWGFCPKQFRTILITEQDSLGFAAQVAGFDFVFEVVLEEKEMVIKRLL